MSFRVIQNPEFLLRSRWSMYEHKAEKKHIKFPHFWLFNNCYPIYRRCGVNQETCDEWKHCTSLTRWVTIGIRFPINLKFTVTAIKTTSFSKYRVHAACKNSNNRFLHSVHKILYILGLAWWRWPSWEGLQKPTRTMPNFRSSHQQA